jgi:hypothetical protein
MTWDKTTPAGTESKSQGDDRIREMKEDLETALQADGVFPGSDPDNPVFCARGVRGATGSRPVAGDFGFFFDTTRNQMQRDNGADWQDVATLIPVGARMVFPQPAPPDGWDQIVDHDDKALRIVSGVGGGDGGSHGLSTPPDPAHVHVISSANIDHKHKTTHAVHSGGNSAFAVNPFGLSGDPNGVAFVSPAGSGTFGASWQYALSGGMESNSTHDHGGATANGDLEAFEPLYVDAVLCEKN